MTIETGKERVETAHALHESGEYVEAADSYTAAAYEYFGANGLTHSVSAARGLESLLRGAACLRVSGKRDRYRNLCWQGVYLSQAIAAEAMSRPPESHPHDRSERRVWYEFEADCRALGELPDVDEAYETAERAYRDAGDPQCVSCEQILMAVAVLPKLLFRGTSADSDDLNEMLRPGTTLTEWIRFKRQRLPAVLKRLDEEDEWTYVF